jgi:hypothetical protein
MVAVVLEDGGVVGRQTTGLGQEVHVVLRRVVLDRAALLAVVAHQLAHRAQSITAPESPCPRWYLLEHRDRDFGIAFARHAYRDRRVVLLDQVTQRVATRRVWHRELDVELGTPRSMTASSMGRAPGSGAA